MKQCPNCGHDNKETQLYCEKCYTSVEWIHTSEDKIRIKRSKNIWQEPEVTYECRQGDSLKIEIPWFRGLSALYGVGTSIGSIILFGIGIDALIQVGWEDGGSICAGPAFILAFLLGFMGLGLIFNKTEIKVNKRKLIVRHEPIPSLAAKISIALSDIGDWSIDEKRQHDEYGNVSITNYQLLIHDKSIGRNITLIKGVRSYGEVNRIQSEIRDFIRSLKHK